MFTSLISSFLLQKVELPQWQVIQLTPFSVCGHWVSFLWRCFVPLKRCTDNAAVTNRVTATQAHLAAFRPQGNLSFPEQLYQCFSREKGFQRALPGQSKLPGSCGSFLCLQLTWQTGRSRGLLLLCLSQRWKWYAQNSSGISREILQGGEHFWCPAMCCWELFSASVWPMAHFHFPSIRR